VAKLASRTGFLDAHLRMLLNGSIGIGQFWDWLIESEDDIEVHGSPDEVELARMLALRFDEFSSGHIDRNQLAAALRREIEASGLSPAEAPAPSAALPEEAAP
jgi:hypothetical protein